MKMEPTESSETSAFSTRTPGRYPKENALQFYNQPHISVIYFKFVFCEQPTAWKQLHLFAGCSLEFDYVFSTLV